MNNTNNSGLNLKHARTPEQIALMKKIIDDGVCPFCKEYFAKYHPKPILKETEYWFFAENMSPYKGTKYHFIFVYKPTHITKLSEVLPEALVDLFSLINRVIVEYNIHSGSLFIRFGDTHYTGSSVEHLHAHIIMGDVDVAGHEAVRVKLG